MITARTRKRDGRRVYDVRLRDAAGRMYNRTFETKRDALVFEAAERVDKSRGRWIDPRRSSTPFETVAASWMATGTAKRASSTARDQSIITHHLIPALSGRAVVSISTADVQALVNEWAARQAPSTVGRQYATLRAIMTYAVNDDLISRSPCRGIRLPRNSSREAQIVTGDDLEALAEAMPTYAPMPYLGVLGLRWGEIAGLRIRSVDFDRQTITVTEQRTRGEKGRMVEQAPKSDAGRRTVAAPSWLITMLQRHVSSRGAVDAGADDFVFVAPDGGPLHYTNWRRRVWLPALSATGLPDLHFHDLKHTAGTALVMAGVDIKTTQARLGHATPQLTLRVYAQATEQADRAAAEKVGAVFRPRRGASSEGATAPEVS